MFTSKSAAVLPHDPGARCFRLGAGLLAALLAFCPAGAAQKAGGKTTGAGSKPASAFHQLAERAAVARSVGRLDEAIKLYREALRGRPQWKEGWWALELEAAARLAPDSAEVWFALARVYGRAGRKQAAARARAEFLRLDQLRSSNTR